MKRTEPNSLIGAPDAVFRVWKNRRRVEVEAAGLFAKLAKDLSAFRGADDEVAKMAMEACRDELRHKEFCEEILRSGSQTFDDLTIDAEIQIGPLALSREKRALYTAVAVGCVTESLSTALLIEMREKASPEIIRDTVHRILTDEVNHSRIGWAELARAAKSSDVSWLQAHIPDMIEAAFVSDIGPMLNADEAKMDLSEWGILPPSRARELMAATVSEVIIPGFKHFGITVEPRA